MVVAERQKRRQSSPSRNRRPSGTGALGHLPEVVSFVCIILDVLAIIMTVFLFISEYSTPAVTLKPNYYLSTCTSTPRCDAFRVSFSSQVHAYLLSEHSYSFRMPTMISSRCPVLILPLSLPRAL